MKIHLSFFVVIYYNGFDRRRVMDYEEILRCLQAAAEPQYAAFQQKVVSDTAYPILGVRMAQLRTLAKQAASGDWRRVLEQAKYQSYEEVMVCGLMIAYAPASLVDKIPYLCQFLPLVDSWGLTDSIVPTLKLQEKERTQLWDFAMECLASPLTYTVRFGIVLMLRFFLTEDRISEVAGCLTAIRDDRYYVNMAVAWCLAELALHDYEVVENILKSGTLNRFTHQKTIQKMRESYRLTKDKKDAAALLRRK